MSALTQFRFSGAILCTLSAAALATGCKTHSGSSSYAYNNYSSWDYNAYGYNGLSATSARTSDQTRGARVESSASTNTVIPLYQESIQVGKRDVDSSVRLRKVIKTETVNQPIELRSESVVVEREPAGSPSAGAASAGAFKENEIVIQLHREVPVIEKRVVAGERVIARVRTNVIETNVQGQIRREEIDVIKSGDASVSQDVNAAPAAGGASAPGGQSQGSNASDANTNQTYESKENLGPPRP